MGSDRNIGQGEVLIDTVRGEETRSAVISTTKRVAENKIYAAVASVSRLSSGKPSNAAGFLRRAHSSALSVL